MATTLALAMRASMSAGGVVSGANDASRAIDKMGQQAQKTADDMSVLKNVVIGVVVVKGLASLANAFVAASSAAFSYSQRVAATYDALNDLADRTGMAVTSLQALQMAAKLSGVEDASAAIQKLGVAIGQAAESGKTEAFAKLGLDFEKLEAMSPDAQFEAVQQAISALPTSAQRAAAAVSIFGKAGVELLPLMNENLKQVQERMQALGATLSDDQVNAIDRMNDSLTMVQGTFDGIIGQVTANLAPVVESLTEDFLAFVESFNGGAGGAGVADDISSVLLDVADYFAGIFDNAVSGFDGFGVTLQEVGLVFDFAGNVFTAVAETLRAGFNLFQIAGNTFAFVVGMLLDGLGSFISKDLQQFGRDMAANAERQAARNGAELVGATTNAANAASNAVFGRRAGATTAGPAARAVGNARAQMRPEARAQREAERLARESQAQAAREAAASQSRAQREAEAQRKRQEEAAKIGEQMAAKQKDIDDITAERAAALGGKSNEALKANDVRSSEGMSQFLALATGREDPAIAEYRKQTQKLDEIRGELRALQQEKVDILGAAA
jgi:hypothetical protein